MAVYFFYDEDGPEPFRYLTPTRQIGPLPQPYATEMSPGSYLEFAREDLASDTDRGLINAFGNAKRAFHLSVDSLLNQYGLFTRTRRASFPEKLKLVDAAGMIPIGIMRNLNVERNLLEHEYAVPGRTRVQEAVDVTTLLLLATEKLMERTPQEMVVGWRKPAMHLVMRLEPQLGELRLHRVTAPGKYKKMHGTSVLVGLRGVFGETYSEGVTISAEPWKTIPLIKSKITEWQPIIRSLVEAQRRQAQVETNIHADGVSATIAVTVPISLPDGVSFQEVLEQTSQDRRHERLTATDSDSPGESCDYLANKHFQQMSRPVV
ncbi:MAG: hypothetical protein U1E26_07945 [Coriobacteriia bacterium]|nr:hypothetical protein [Coriobacteriia bacterium]